MLVMLRKDNDPRERVRLLVAGVVYIATVSALIALSIADLQQGLHARSPR